MAEIQKRNYKKAFLAVIGAVVIGAIGSGIWDTALKPAVVGGRNLTLNLFSLGLRSVKDATYVQIALGFREEPAMNVLTFIVWILALGFIGYVIDDFFRTSQRRKIQRALLQRFTPKEERSEDQTISSPQSQSSKTELEQLREQILKDLERRPTRHYVGLLIGIVIASLWWADLTRFKYANSAIAYYKQMSAIASPFMTEADRLTVESKFAQIKNREQYVSVIQSLQTVARDHGQTVPEFSIW